MPLHNSDNRYDKCDVCGGYNCPWPYCATLTDAEEDERIEAAEDAINEMIEGENQ